jgi:hypothetical protein
MNNEKISSHRFHALTKGMQISKLGLYEQAKKIRE